MSSNFLDAEDEEQRRKRLGGLLQRLDESSLPSSVSPNPLLNVGHDSLPGPATPPAELLARVQAFLPAIATSNEVLSRQNPEDINIENVPEDEERYIEMNLGLGVLEAKPRPEPGSRSSPAFQTDSTPDATSESESGSDSSSSTSSSEEEYSSSSSSSDGSDDSDDSYAETQSDSSIDLKPISSRSIRPLPRRVLQKTKFEV